MNLLKKTMFLGIALIVGQVAVIHAQKKCNNKIPFLILEEGTGEAIPSASVGMGNSFSFSDINGFCFMEQICYGTNHLHVISTGYEIVDKDIDIHAKDTIKIYMRISRKSLDEVEVTGHRQMLTTTATANTIKKEELNKTAGGSLANSIQSISGVSMMQTGATISKPVINGMHSNRILVLNNGVRQEGQQWGAEHAPELDPFTAQSITVVKGAAAIQYGGDAMGGVILVDPAPLPTDRKIHGGFNLVGQSNGKSGAASAMLSGNFKKLPAISWRVQGSGKQGGNLKTAHYFLENTGMNEINYSLAAGYEKEHFDASVYYSHFKTELGIFKGSEVGSVEDLEKHIALGRPITDGIFSYLIDAPRQWVAHDLLKIKTHLHLNDYLHFTAQYSFQADDRKEFDIRRGGRTSIPSMDLNLKDHSLNLSLDYFNGKQWKGTFGLAAANQDNKNIPGTFTIPLIPDYTAQNLGVFAIANYLKTNYHFEAGLRYDYKKLNALGYNIDQKLYGGIRNFNNVSGSLGASWNPTPKLNLNTNIGTAWRAPSVSELYSNGLHSGAAAFEVGDSTLQLEQSVKWISSVQFKNKDKWFTISADGYAHYFSNYIYSKPTGQLFQSLQGAFPTFEYAQTNARFLGVDANMNISFLKHFDYGIKGSIIRAKDLSNNRFLPMIPTDRIEQSIRLKLKAMSYLKETYFQFSSVFVAYQSRYDAKSDYAAPPPSYWLFKITAGTTLNIKQQNIQFDFSINNLSNLAYKEYMNRFRYYAHDLGRSIEMRLSYNF